MEKYQWQFHAADMGELTPLNNAVWKNPSHQAALTEARGPHLQATVAGKHLDVEHFDLRSDRLPVTYDGAPATLHIVDGLRVAPSPKGLSQWPRHMHGAIELENPGNSVSGKEIIPVTFLVTDNSLVMYPL